MARSSNAELAVGALISTGVLSDEGSSKLGQLFRGVQALRGGVVGTAPAKRGRGRPRGAAGGATGGRGGPGRKPKVEISREEFGKLRSYALHREAIVELELGDVQ